jgi:hypothetical protein
VKSKAQLDQRAAARRKTVEFRVYLVVHPDGTLRRVGSGPESHFKKWDAEAAVLSAPVGSRVVHGLLSFTVPDA